MTAFDDVRLLMEEPSGERNYGRSAGVPLDVETLQADEERFDENGEMDGFHLVGPDVQFADGGTVAHRGVTHPEEYVDVHRLKDMVEAAFGFTYADVSAAYSKNGRPTTDQRQLRDKIDSRLLALSRSGGNMLALARVFGWTIKSGGRGESCDRMERAMARARKAAE